MDELKNTMKKEKGTYANANKEKTDVLITNHNVQLLGINSVKVRVAIAQPFD